jgi:hypothetical protein
MQIQSGRTVPLMARSYLLCVYLVGDICVLVEPKYLRYILQIQTLSVGKFYTHIYIYHRGVRQKIADQEYTNSDDLLADHQSFLAAPVQQTVDLLITFRTAPKNNGLQSTVLCLNNSEKASRSRNGIISIRRRYTDKKEKKLSSYLRKFRWDRLQCHI